MPTGPEGEKRPADVRRRHGDENCQGRDRVTR